MKEILEQFKKHGDKASYHYADDSTKEWGLAKKEKEFALEIFDNNPKLHDEMRKIADNFLWRLNQERSQIKEKINFDKDIEVCQKCGKVDIHQNHKCDPNRLLNDANDFTYK